MNLMNEISLSCHETSAKTERLFFGVNFTQMKKKIENMPHGFCAECPKLNDTRESLRNCNRFDIFCWFSEGYFHLFQYGRFCNTGVALIVFFLSIYMLIAIDHAQQVSNCAPMPMMTMKNGDPIMSSFSSAAKD